MRGSSGAVIELARFPILASTRNEVVAAVGGLDLRTNEITLCQPVVFFDLGDAREFSDLEGG